MMMKTCQLSIQSTLPKGKKKVQDERTQVLANEEFSSKEGKEKIQR
jgi:hypothetical protein